MGCLYTLPLARPVQAKIQVLTTSSSKSNIFYGAKLVFRLFATFFGLTIFSSGGKGFTLLAAGQFATTLQEFGLWGS